MAAHCQRSALWKLSISSLITVLGMMLVGYGCKPDQKEEKESTPLGISDTVDGKKVKLIDNAPLVREMLPETNKRKTALIFYIADTAEPYMQGAVAHEIRALLEACTDTHVNWVAFVNSHYKNKTYLKCVEGKFSKETYAIEDLDEKIKVIGDESFDPSLKDKNDARTKLFDAELALAHPASLNKAYQTQPFIHPEIMKTIMTYAMTQIFSAKDYSYFVTIKGHGGSKFALTGLTEAQLEKKVKDQSKILSQKNFDIVSNLKEGEVGLNVTSAQDILLGKLWLGQLRPRGKPQHEFKTAFDKKTAGAKDGLNADIEGLNADIPGLNADIPGLNADIPGLNADITGLNADITGLNADIPGLNADIPGLNADIVGLGVDSPGLGADNHFGMTTKLYFASLGKALRAASVGEHKAELSFLNMESCESRVRGKIGDTTPLLELVMYLRPAFKAGYSAEGSLWYRSYDWNNIYYSWLENPTAPNMQKMLIQLSTKVKNFSYE
jgi:hypothetical protein